MKKIIVSRHPATVAYLRDELGPSWADAPALASATADDVRDAIVGGNLPLHLAALAWAVVAVEFEGDPPRGAEYGRAEMEAAGVRLRVYSVEYHDSGTAQYRYRRDTEGLPAEVVERRFAALKGQPDFLRRPEYYARQDVIDHTPRKPESFDEDEYNFAHPHHAG